MEYRLISWNVNGLRAVAGKGFADIFVELDADFFCLQETKMQEGQLDLEFPGYQSYWNYADKKAIPARQSIQSIHRSACATVWEWTSMTTRAAL